MNAVVRETVDPAPMAAVNAAEQARIEAHAAANAATLAFNEADRALGSAEKELSALLHRPGFERPRKEEIDVAMAKVAAMRKTRDDAKTGSDEVLALMSWRGQEVTRARRVAFEPVKLAAAAQMVELAERADGKRAELAAIGAEFDVAAADYQAAVAAGAHGGGGYGFRFERVTSVAALRVALRGVCGQAAF